MLVPASDWMESCLDGRLRERDSVMVAQVPANAGVQTLFSRLGPVLAWACVVALAVLVGRCLMQAVS